MPYLPVLQMFLLSAMVTGLSATGQGPIFHTQYGAVRGMYVDEGVIVLGLPFGQPPVNELRWKAPKPFKTSWAPDIRDGTVPGPACPQDGCGPKASDVQHTCPRDGKLSEDCLYLNIFAPHTVVNSTVKLPVLFWLHGGSFHQGTGSCLAYDGRFLANKTNTVVVTTNYRLGAFGFLVAGEGENAATGNYGILDQIEALKWIQANIGGFGGDKNHVTIFGQSSGADSVGIHMTNNRSADLFEKAIMHSLPFSINHKSHFEAVNFGNRFAELLNCSQGNMTCIRSKTTDQLLTASGKAESFIVNPLRPLERFVQWGPYLDGDILTAEPITKFANGQFHKKPFIIGTVREEAVLYIYEEFQKNVSKLQLDEVAVAFVHGKAAAVLREYHTPPSQDYRRVISEIVTDWLWACSTRNAIRSAVSGGEADVWLYIFDHIWSLNLWGHGSPCHGHVCHGEDLPFIFQTVPLGANLSFTADEQVMADTIAYHYGNFAHTGDPNKPGHRLASPTLKMSAASKWPKYNKENHFPILNITTPQNTLMQDFRKEKCDFWDKENIYTRGN